VVVVARTTIAIIQLPKPTAACYELFPVICPDEKQEGSDGERVRGMNKGGRSERKEVGSQKGLIDEEFRICEAMEGGREKSCLQF